MPADEMDGLDENEVEHAEFYSRQWLPHLSRTGACQLDAGISFAAGFVPGVKVGLAVTEMIGIEFTFVGAYYGYKEWVSWDDLALKGALGAGFDMMEEDADDYFYSLGGDKALDRVEGQVNSPWYQWKSAQNQIRKAQDLYSLQQAKAVAKTLGLVGNVLAAGEFAFDLNDCYNQ